MFMQIPIVLISACVLDAYNQESYLIHNLNNNKM
jgi:hypothetical protein